MEPAPIKIPQLNLRTDVCLILKDVQADKGRGASWSAAAEDCVRRLHKLGLQIAIIGPKPVRKFGSKKSIHFLDRHEVVGMKELMVSKSHRYEIRILNRKNKSWIRLRTEVCITVGNDGVLPVPFEGWMHPGVMPIQTLSRIVSEFDWVPAREIAFLGSSNRALRWANWLLDQGVLHCYVIETDEKYQCWRSLRDRFLAKGGRLLLKHQLVRVTGNDHGVKEIHLKNENAEGTLILNVDLLVLMPYHDEAALNSPDYWKRGLFYLKRRYEFTHLAPADEEVWLEELDWKEIYWRVAKFLELASHGEADGSIKNIKSQRKKYYEYRKTSRDLTYNGKILDRDSMDLIRASGSVPKTFIQKKPIASLECLQEVPCRACVDVCPEAAIDLLKLTSMPQLREENCTGCGACVAVCPAGAAVMVRESDKNQKANYFLPDDTHELWKEGESVQLLNRRGDVLGVGRIAGPAKSFQAGLHRVLEIEASNIYLFEARGFRKPQSAHEKTLNIAPTELKRGWVTLNGVRRLYPLGVPLSLAFLQMGLKRFEDMLFCPDRSCGLCQIEVNDKPVLACQTICEEGLKISVSEPRSQDNLSLLCPCSKVTQDHYLSLVSECKNESCVREITGMGAGPCHGRWCLNSKILREGDADFRPSFHGYDISPWRDFDADDLV